MTDYPSDRDMDRFQLITGNRQPVYVPQTARSPHHAATSPRRQPSPRRKKDKRNIILVLVICMFVMLVGILAIVLLRGSNPNALTAVQQPPSASQLAADFGCSGFESGDIGGSGMVVSAGSCTKGNDKYAIDTFVSKNVRNQWLQAAEPLGVRPFKMTDTGVIYPSVS